MDEKSKTGLPDGENIPQKKSTTYGQIVKYTGILGGTQALTMAVSLVRNKLATVFLGAVGMGLVALYQSLMAFVANITNLGLAMSAVKHVSDTQEHCSSQETNRYVAMVRTWVLATAVGGTLLCVLLAPVLNYFSFSGKEDHTLDIVFLAPMIGFLAVTGGELALLKAARRLKWIAWASLLCGGLTLLTTIPFYYFFREQGIVAALLCSTFAVMCVYIYYARRVYPWQLLKPSPHLWQQGMGLVRLGMAFILSSIFASLAEWVIPVAILRHASLEEVAFFKMGFSLMVTYPGMVFVALEASGFEGDDRLGKPADRGLCDADRSGAHCLYAGLAGSGSFALHAGVPAYCGYGRMCRYLYAVSGRDASVGLSAFGEERPEDIFACGAAL